MKKPTIPLLLVGIIVLFFGVLYSRYEALQESSGVVVYPPDKLECVGEVNGIVILGHIVGESDTQIQANCDKVYKKADDQVKQMDAEYKKYCTYMQGKPMSYADYEDCQQQK